MGITKFMGTGYMTQTRGWLHEDVEEYEQIKSRADKVIYISPIYTKGYMFKGNRHLVDYRCACICYLTKENEGTVYTARYAK